ALKIHDGPGFKLHMLRRFWNGLICLTAVVSESCGYMMRFLALEWYLEEIRVTWAHLENKRAILQLYTIYLEELCSQSVETALRVLSDDIMAFKATALEIWR
ncbi:hypothetical protein Tco_1579420, partial [Tanacetum coccineum]